MLCGCTYSSYHYHPPWSGIWGWDLWPVYPGTLSCSRLAFYTDHLGSLHGPVAAFFLAWRVSGSSVVHVCLCCILERLKFRLPLESPRKRRQTQLSGGASVNWIMDKSCGVVFTHLLALLFVSGSPDYKAKPGWLFKGPSVHISCALTQCNFSNSLCQSTIWS